MSFIYKYKTSTTHPLYETTGRFVLKINEARECNLPYMQFALRAIWVRPKIHSNTVI